MIPSQEYILYFSFHAWIKQINQSNSNRSKNLKLSILKSKTLDNTIINNVTTEQWNPIWKKKKEEFLHGGNKFYFVCHFDGRRKRDEEGKKGEEKSFHSHKSSLSTTRLNLPPYFSTGWRNFFSIPPPCNIIFLAVWSRASKKRKDASSSLRDISRYQEKQRQLDRFLIGAENFSNRIFFFANYLEGSY